jgi:hypothetical protein
VMVGSRMLSTGTLCSLWLMPLGEALDVEECREPHQSLSPVASADHGRGEVGLPIRRTSGGMSQLATASILRGNIL